MLLPNNFPVPGVGSPTPRQLPACFRLSPRCCLQMFICIWSRQAPPSCAVIGRAVTGAVSSAAGRLSFQSGLQLTDWLLEASGGSLPLLASWERTKKGQPHPCNTSTLFCWKMIICTSKMEYPLRTQCQRVQKQVGYKVSWLSTGRRGEGDKLVLTQLKLAAANWVTLIHLPEGSFIPKIKAAFFGSSWIYPDWPLKLWMKRETTVSLPFNCF